MKLGDVVRWVPTGDVGTIIGLTTEPSAIVLFPHGRQTIGLSRLQETNSALPITDGVLGADEVGLAIEGLLAIASGDAGSWPARDREHAHAIAERLRGGAA